MAAPPGSYYYDMVYGACEPCYSPTSGANDCIYSARDPRDAGWIVDDDDVYPPDARGCAADEKYDLLLQKCRPLCPGEGSGGQEFVYADDNSSGSCQCYDADHFAFDPASATCVLKAATARRMKALRGAANPGDPFPACDPPQGLMENCYFGDVDSCMNVYQQMPEEDGIAVLRQAQYRACPYTLCPSGSKNGKGCVCVGTGLGNRVMAAGKSKKGRKHK